MNKKIIGLIVLCMLIFSACQVRDDNNKIHNGNENTDINQGSNETNQENIDQENDSQDNIDQDTDGEENSGNENSENIDEDNKDIDEVKEINYQEVKPYEVGHIMVVMYHGIIDNPPYHRTEEDFRKDLEYMYDNGYRLLSLRDYLDNNITIEAGYTPIVLTFDDGLSSTFSLVEQDGELVPAPGTAIAIMEEFAKEHPDFGKTAALHFFGAKSDNFEGAGTLQERIKWLVDNGYDVGNHTYNHTNLYKSNAEQIQWEIARTDKIIKEAVPGYTVDFIAYPFGKRPKKELLHFVESGSYDNHTYQYQIGMREGPSGPFVSPLHVDFDPFNMPRVRGSEGDIQDLWWFFDYYDKQHPDYKYVSDGNPDRVALPSKYEHKINKDKLGDKELYLYELEE